MMHADTYIVLRIHHMASTIDFLMEIWHIYGHQYQDDKKHKMKKIEYIMFNSDYHYRWSVRVWYRWICELVCTSTDFKCFIPLYSYATEHGKSLRWYGKLPQLLIYKTWSLSVSNYNDRAQLTIKWYIVRLSNELVSLQKLNICHPSIYPVYYHTTYLSTRKIIMIKLKSYCQLFTAEYLFTTYVIVIHYIIVESESLLFLSQSQCN